MRLAVKININIIARRDREFIVRTSNRESFWNAYFGSEASFRERPDFSIDEIERRLLNIFPRSIEKNLRYHFLEDFREGYIYKTAPNITVIIKDISYGSLNISADIIAPALDSIGITPNDILELLNRYTFEALAEVTQHRPSEEIEVKSTGNTIELNAINSTQPANLELKADEKSKSLKNIDKIWAIANTSLVIPAIVLLTASYLIFQSASEERSRMIASLTQERAELASERQKMFDKYSEQIKGYRDVISDQLKHLGDLNEIETKLLQEKLKQIKGATDK